MRSIRACRFCGFPVIANKREFLRKKKYNILRGSLLTTHTCRSVSSTFGDCSVSKKTEEIQQLTWLLVVLVVASTPFVLFGGSF